MKKPAVTLEALLYPGAELLQEGREENCANCLLHTEDDIARVWKWYSKRLHGGVSPVSIGLRRYEDGPVWSAHRRTARLFDRANPFSDSEEPQVLTTVLGTTVVTVVLTTFFLGGTNIIVFWLQPEDSEPSRVQRRTRKGSRSAEGASAVQG